MCNDGLLTLNTGIVDPGWHGRVSSFILNFGKDKHPLVKGDVFLRITFHKLSAEDPIGRKEVDDGQYIVDRRRRMVKDFSPYFLNLPDIIQRSVDASFGNLRDVATKYVPMFAAGLALLTFLLNFATLGLVQRWFQPSDDRLLQRIQILERQLEIRESPRGGPASPQQLNSSSPRGSPDTTAPATPAPTETPSAPAPSAPTVRHQRL
jgi:hypothetical protein